MAGEKIRIDKWMWAVRIFKSRTISTETCKSGKVRLNNVTIKPSALCGVGDQIELKRQGFTFTYKIEAVIQKRVSAILAAPCYTNTTPAEELNKYKNWFVGKSGVESRERGSGRPTKRERREIDDYKDFNVLSEEGWGEEE